MVHDVFELCNVVRQTGFDLHKYLGGGHMEKVYENGLAHRLTNLGLKVCPQYALRVTDEDGTILGDYFADLFVEDCLIVEIKACGALIDEHVAQLLGYLRACNVKHGMLINFGTRRFQVRKYVL